MRRMRQDVIHMRERTTASGIRTETVERNQGESHTNGASSPPPLSLIEMRRMRREFPCVSEQQPVVSELKQSSAIKAKAIQMVRLVLPLSLFFFFFYLFLFFLFFLFLRGEREGPPKGPLQNHSPSLIFFFFKGEGSTERVRVVKNTTLTPSQSRSSSLPLPGSSSRL